MPKNINILPAKKLLSAVFCDFYKSLVIVSFSLVLALLAQSSTFAASISAGSTAYTASLSTGDTVNIPQTGSIIPTADSKVYTSAASDSNVKFSSTCPKGSSISVNTDNSSTALVHVSDSSKTIPATSKAITSATSATLNPSTGSSLADNTWGLSLDSGNTFAYVPAKGSPVVLYKSTKAEGSSTNPITIPVIYGVKVNNKIPSGTYSNSVVYTLAVSGECLTYPLSFDANGGTIANTAYNYNTQNLNYGQTINLANYKPKKDGYVFAGWTATYTKADGSTSSSSFSGGETNLNINPSNLFAVKVKANWSNEVANFDYTGTVQTYTAPADGYYKLEVWGAQGSTYKIRYDPSGESYGRGGYGAYSAGILDLKRSTPLYVGVGQQYEETGITFRCNATNQGTRTIYSGSFNGGGGWVATYNEPILAGGGATSITLVSDQLQNLGNNKNAVIVTAGGGGAGTLSVSSRHDGVGGDAGGATGNPGKPYVGDVNGIYAAGGGTQTTGGKGGGRDADLRGEDGIFGKGGAGKYRNYGSCNNFGGGGGGGYYGGGGGQGHGSSGGGGSGYIGNSSLISGAGITKHMYGYNVPTSNDANTKTITGTCANSTPTADCAKIGNGYARITYLGSAL